MVKDGRSVQISDSSMHCDDEDVSLYQLIQFFTIAMTDFSIVLTIFQNS